MLNRNKKFIKLYEVTFNTYTNWTNDTVANYEDEEDTCYITIPKTGLIIREDEIELYKKYGNGFASLTIVGEMLVEE